MTDSADSTLKTPSTRRRDEIYTPDSVAAVMASWLDFELGVPARVLDPGAGAGILTEAVINRLADSPHGPVEIQMVEANRVAARALAVDLRDWAVPEDTSVEIFDEDFVAWALKRARQKSFTHAILNPPYLKLPSSDLNRSVLKDADVEVSNYYGVFLWLSADLLVPGGQLVAIVPRSFCNGPTFRRLRERLLRDFRLTRIHAFASREEVFERDSVLQETVIIRLVRSAEFQSDISVSWSESSEVEAAVAFTVPPLAVLRSDGTINVPSATWRNEPNRDNWVPMFEGLSVSTGPVVDFRVAEVTNVDEPGAVVLIGSNSPGLSKKASSQSRFLRRTPDSEKLIFPSGNYVAIKRISPTEQVPRIRAILVSEEETSGRRGVAFENHVNVVHRDGAGLTSEEAATVLSRLSATDTELQFSNRSGSTQVNVSDLKSLLTAPD